MSSTSHDYVVGFIALFQCLSLIVLNVWDNEWLDAIEALEEGIRKAKKEQKNILKKMIYFVHNTLMHCVQIEMGKIKKPIRVDNNNKKNHIFL
jgi:hypothetical protein